MSFDEFKNKVVSLIVWNTEEEDDVHVYLGEIFFENNGYYFINEKNGWRVSLFEEHLVKVKPVPDDLKVTLLGAEYSLSMVMSILPDAERNGIKLTGINWRDQP